MSPTPGPWTLMVDVDSGVLREIAAPCHEHPNCGKTIVFIHRDPTKPFQCAHGEHMEANARLIAAAPDLLEAAKHAAMEWRLHGQLTDSCRVLEAAIARAEGR